uniref:Uncharacterized protein n=1 Tax=Arundo donax TaxID=35708 RepID=A0A0A9DMT8_ARUDO
MISLLLWNEFELKLSVQTRKPRRGRLEAPDGELLLVKLRSAEFIRWWTGGVLLLCQIWTCSRPESMSK